MPPHEPLFLLDNSLNPAIAEALRKVGFNIHSVKDIFGDPPDGVKDPTIIDWCAEHRATWLTTDVAAKR